MAAIRRTPSPNQGCKPSLQQALLSKCFSKTCHVSKIVFVWMVWFQTVPISIVLCNYQVWDLLKHCSTAEPWIALHRERMDPADAGRDCIRTPSKGESCGTGETDQASKLVLKASITGEQIADGVLRSWSITAFGDRPPLLGDWAPRKQSYTSVVSQGALDI